MAKPRVSALRGKPDRPLRLLPGRRRANYGILLPRGCQRRRIRSDRLGIRRMSDSKLSCSAGNRAMRRRGFIALLGGAAAPWPLMVRAQQPDQLRRIGVLMAPAASDPGAGTYLSRFAQALHEVGWTAGSTVQMEVRWASGALDRMRTHAKELVALQPDVILSNGTAVTAALQRETKT